MGAKVVLAVRDPAKGNAAAAKIKGSVEVSQLDLGDLGSVKAFAKRWGDRPVDVLMLNAGVMAIPERSLTKDGFERHYAVNHLGHFALTALLWPSVRKAAEKGEGGGARVVVVSSDGHKKGSIGAPPSRRGTATRTHARTHARTHRGRHGSQRVPPPASQPSTTSTSRRRARTRTAPRPSAPPTRSRSSPMCSSPRNSRAACPPAST